MLIESEKISNKSTKKHLKNEKSLESYRKLVNRISEANLKSHEISHYFTGNTAPISEKIIKSKSRKEIENQGLEQDQKLKKYTLIALFVFLGIETFAVFLFTYFQAIGTTGIYTFHLEEWSFKLLIAATISQITAMLLKAVTHLFPDNKQRLAKLKQII